MRATLGDLRRTRALARRHIEMSGPEFVLLVLGWGAAAVAILTISLLLRCLV